MLGLSNPIHIVFLLGLLLLAFGAKRLPEMGRSLGAGMRGFKESLGGEEEPAALPSGEPERLVQTPPSPTVSVAAPAPATADDAGARRT